MGFEMAEILMAVEDEFGIEFPEDVAFESDRVGDWVGLIFDLLPRNTISGLETKWTGDVDERFQKVLGQRISNLPPDTKVLDLFGPGKKYLCYRRRGQESRAIKTARATDPLPDPSPSSPR